MTDKNWQKVRVAFDDADGNRVEAVMWQVTGKSGTVKARSGGPNLWIEWINDFENVTVTRVYDLPTGVGAVIRLTGPTATGDDLDDLYVHGVDDTWRNWESDIRVYTDVVRDWQFEVLSEGIQIGDVQ